MSLQISMLAFLTSRVEELEILASILYGLVCHFRVPGQCALLGTTELCYTRLYAFSRLGLRMTQERVRLEAVEIGYPRSYRNNNRTGKWQDQSNGYTHCVKLCIPKTLLLSFGKRCLRLESSLGFWCNS